MGDFTIQWNAERRLLDVMITGTWNSADAQRFHDAITGHAARTRPFDMMVDIHTETILPANAAGEIEVTMAHLARQGLRRAAHVTSSALAAMQIRRIGATYAEMGFFPDRAAAFDWLAAAD